MADIDGTLLAPGNELEPSAERLIPLAQAAGLHVVLATGRMYRSAAQWAERLTLRGPVITYNGGLIAEYPGGRTVRHRPVTLSAAREIAAACHTNGWYLQAYFDDRLYVPALGAEAEGYCRIAGVEPRLDPDAVWHPRRAPTKLLVIAPPADVPAIADALRMAAGEAVQMFTSFTNYLEIQAAGVSKANAVRWVARRLGVPAHAVLALGDGENDAEMVAAAGVGVAVANAGPAVRQAADFITARPYGAGVAEALAACLTPRS